MARVNTYTQDSVVSGIDKVLGTDVHTGATKNFTFNSVSEWLNSAGAVKIIGQNNYVFQSVGEFPADRLAGNISFLNFGGDGTLFSDVTELIFSDASAGNTSAAPYITTLVGKQVILANLKDLSNFGVYTLQSFIELDTEPGFYQATLVFINGSGALEEAEAYGIAAEGLQAQGGTWGSIAGTITDQTDLVNYVDAEIAAIPTPETPTLQSVTDAGSTTTNSITSQSISLDAENGGGIFNSAYSDVNILPKSNAFEFNVRTSSNTGKLRVSTDGALYLASNANALNLGKLYSGQYPKKQLQLGLTGSGYTAFYDSNGVNELMRVDGATGNVGIGTTAPSPTAGTKGLHLVAPTNQSSEIKLDTTDSDRGTYLTFAKAGVSKWDIYSPGDNSLRFRELQVPSSTPLTLLDGGNVGIGTTAPTEKLHVEGSIFIKNNRFIRSKDGGSTVYDLLGVLSNGHVQVGQPNRGLKFRGGGPASDIYFELAGSTQFILKGNTGNVGIGTTAPQQKLHVEGTIRIGPDVDLSRYGGRLYTAQDIVLGALNAETANITVNASNKSVLGVRRPSSGTVSVLKVRDYFTQDVYIDIDSDGVADFAGTVKTDTGFEAYRVGARRVFLGGTSTKGQLLLDNNGTWDVNLTGGSDKYFASGNFGIGTTSPAAKLDVDGDVLIKAASEGHTVAPLIVQNTIPYQSPFSQYLQLWKNSGGTNIMYLRADGSIVNTGGTQSKSFIATQSSTLSSIPFRASNSGTTGMYFPSAGNIGFANNASETMRITSDGNVGIGTTSPEEKLHVQGGLVKVSNADNSRYLTFGAGTFDASVASGGGGRLFLQSSSVMSLNTTNVGIGVSSPVGNGKLQVSGNAWFTNGNVGVGTTSPSYKLDVVGTSRIQNELILGDNAGTAGILHFRNPGFGSYIQSNGYYIFSTLRGVGNQFRIKHATASSELDINVLADDGLWYLTPRGPSNSNGTLAIRNPNNSTKFTFNTNSGNLGIGTTSPAVSLDVDGEVHLGPQSTTGFPSIDIASNGRTTIRGSAPALTVRDNNNNGGYIDMGGGTLASINSITSSAQLSFSSTNVRFGGDIAARVNIVGQDSSSQNVLGLKQGASGSNIMIDIRNSSNVSTMGITSEGGFYFRDSNLVGRYRFDHDYAPSPADGLTTGFEFRTENKNGVLTTFGYIDVTNDDRTLQESSMRLSVGESTPTEVMRLQSDGNVGIGQVTPDAKLHVSTTSGTAFKVNPNNTDKEWYIDTTNPDHLKKGQNLILHADPTNVHTSTSISFNIDGSNKMRIQDNGRVGIGTTSPGGHLHVIDSGNLSNGGIFIQNTGATAATLGLENTEGTSRLFTNNGITTLRNIRTGFSSYSIDVGARGVKIKEGNGGQNSDASAILDIDSTTQGVLFPRMTEAEKDSISSPATGLIIYQTDAQDGLYIYKSSGWVQII